MVQSANEAIVYLEDGSSNSLSDATTYADTADVYVKGEYRYSQYQEGEVEAPSGLESDRFDVDLDRHQFVVGVGARF